MKPQRLSLCLMLMLCPPCWGQNATKSDAAKPYTAYMVANAHFDTQWRWDVRRSIGEFLLNTLDQNFALFETYPDYTFNFEGAIKYAWAKEYYPERFERLREYVRQGRWHLSGSSWDATDTNVPSPESMIRNILLGQEFFKSEFGLSSSDILLPDCFGFGYALPTVAAHCGLIGFSTQKLDWREGAFHNGQKKPFTLGLWQGVDGSRIFAALDGGGYGWNPAEDLSYSEDLIDRASRATDSVAMRYYGTRSTQLRGDRGGSPLPRTVKNIRRSMLSDGPVAIINATSDAIMRRFMPFDTHPELPVFDGELLMDVHGTGCYTSQAAMKYYNRQNEQRADRAERSSVVADWLGVLPYSGYELGQSWRLFLWHQFHDDLTGTSIPDAYRYSWNDEIVALKRFSQVEATAVECIAGMMDTRVKGVPMVVYNPSGVGYDGYVHVEVPAELDGGHVVVCNEKGAVVPSQVIDRGDGVRQIVFTARVEPVGFVVYQMRRAKRATSCSTMKITEHGIENSVYRLKVDGKGDICSLVDKRSGRELVAEGDFFGPVVLTPNRSDRWPAWEIRKKCIDLNPESLNDVDEISVEHCGSVQASLRVVRRLGKSVVEQHIALYEGADADRIDIRYTVDWASPNTLLKVQFPMSFAAPQATYDLGVGHIGRGNNTARQYEVPAQRWVDMSAEDNTCGLTIFSDSKYGWDKPSDNNIRLTLLHTPSTDREDFAHQNALDLGHHTFMYSIVAHDGGFSAIQAERVAAAVNFRPEVLITEAHEGPLGRNFSFVECDNHSIGIMALKKAEDGNGYIIRVCEAEGKPQNGKLRFAAPVVQACRSNGVEEFLSEACIESGVLCVALKPFEPQTFRISIGQPSVTFRRPVQNQLRLPFNANVISSDAFVAVAAMDADWNSLSGDLLPRTLLCQGVEYHIGAADYGNAVKCKGQKIELPSGAWRKLHLLVASSCSDRRASFRVGESVVDIDVPYYSGFYGQWGWTGYSDEYCRTADLAWIGTHRHNPYTRNEPYVFTYIYKHDLDLPAGCSSLTLPDDENIVVFAVTLEE